LASKAKFSAYYIQFQSSEVTEFCS